MSPVSRGRKPKKQKKATGSRTRLAPAPPATEHPSRTEPTSMQVLMSRVGRRERPDWFDHSTKTVLDRSDELLAARGPAELEQLTAEILGAELHRVAHSRGEASFFDWWFRELVAAAAARVREHPDGVSEPHWWLLHGLVAIGGPALRSIAEATRDELSKELRRQLRALAPPSWLRLVSLVKATGEVWRLCDAYGARFGMIAAYVYPGQRDRSVFLFDIDACGFIRLANAGVFDGVEQAGAAWRTHVGEPAGGAQPVVVDTPAGLLPLSYCELDELTIRRDESRSTMDNWFRANRRIHDLADALRRRGTPLPAQQSLYRDIDPEPMAEEFTAWYARRNGTELDPESAIALAEEWMEGALPDTWHAASPHRIEFQLSLINDWDPGDPVTIDVKTLLPEWVRWHGEQAGTPSALVDRAVAVAQGGQRAPSDCASQSL